MSAKGLASYAFSHVSAAGRERHRATAAVDDNRWGIPHSYSPMEYIIIIHDGKKNVKQNNLNFGIRISQF